METKVDRQKSAKFPTVVQINPRPLHIMAKNKKIDPVKEQEYIAFLKKRLDSSNYKANVSKEEYDKTKEKYDRAKLRLRLLQ